VSRRALLFPAFRNGGGCDDTIGRVLGSAILTLGVSAALAAPQNYGYGSRVDPSSRATYGEIYLDSGFNEDPYTVQVTSGGSIDASDVSGGCVGMVSSAPDFQLTYDAGTLPLTFGTISRSDTTLMINGPDGAWACDDDSGGDGDALITYRRPSSGVYDVWVGAYGGDSNSAELFITELSDGGYGDRDRRGAYDDGGGYGGQGVYPDASLQASYGEVYLDSGFTPDPYVVYLSAGGSFDASDLRSGCVGMIAGAPDFQLTYDAGSLPLIVSVEADSDTTLVINGPDGAWYCDDDGGQYGSNPAIRFNRPQSGTYDVWVGSYSGEGGSAELNISEVSSQ
jgi:hypothetical protein